MSKSEPEYFHQSPSKDRNLYAVLEISILKVFPLREETRTWPKIVDEKWRCGGGKRKVVVVLKKQLCIRSS